MEHKPVISVLMSVYNETERQIRESVESILNQTFADLELIIVCDDPQRTDVKPILDSFNDRRIVYYQNPQNIALALSMNKASELAKADIFARMDADDISELNRFEEELPILQSGMYDFVCSKYSVIDMQSKSIDYRTDIEDRGTDINSEVPINPNVIHHPTVMFTRSIFEKVGGYRDFPCAQDADLWLRMHEAGCRFYMVNKKLLKYRLNPNGVTISKRYRSILTINYIYSLSLMRLQKGTDTFSKENYKLYMKRHGYGSSFKEKVFTYSLRLKEIASQKEDKGKVYYATILRAMIFLICPAKRAIFLMRRRKHKLLR
ncbi:MAG: glycosyltransferase [Prevotella sp.]|nr:glycosyltransferase [Prevotella sp.]